MKHTPTKSLLAGTLLTLITATSAAADRIPMYRYSNINGDRLYTASYAELGAGGGGWIYEGVPGYVSLSATPGTQPMDRYSSARSRDHFFTTSFAELGGGAGGYIFEGIAFYVPTSSANDTLPLHRFRKADSGQHFYSTNFNEVVSGPVAIPHVTGGGQIYYTYKTFWVYEGMQAPIWKTP